MSDVKFRPQRTRESPTGRVRAQRSRQVLTGGLVAVADPSGRPRTRLTTSFAVDAKLAQPVTRPGELESEHAKAERDDDDRGTRQHHHGDADQHDLPPITATAMRRAHG